MADFDLLVVGGGPVAHTLVRVLTPVSWTIGLVDPGWVGASEKSIALNHESRRILEEVAPWQTIANHATAITDINVSRAGELGRCSLSARDIHRDALGWVVNEAELIHWLSAERGVNDSVTVYRSRAIGFHAEPHSGTVELEDGATVSAKLVIGADGLASPLRQSANIRCKLTDLHSSALCAEIRGSRPHHGRAWERFDEAGPIALLPVAEGYYSLVWCLRPDEVDSILELSEEQFLQQLQSRFGFAAGNFLAAGNRVAFPLIHSSCPRPFADRLLLIGSAARQIHPVAGQGLNLALRDLRTLADLLAETAQREGDPGEPLLLNHYCQLRNRDWRLVEQATRLLPAIFSADLWPLKTGRSLALTALALTPPLRRALIRRATGDFSYRPRLSR